MIDWAKTKRRVCGLPGAAWEQVDDAGTVRMYDTAGNEVDPAELERVNRERSGIKTEERLEEKGDDSLLRPDLDELERSPEGSQEAEPEQGDDSVSAPASYFPMWFTPRGRRHRS